MAYHELLRDAVYKSGWSMREISRRANAKGVKLSQGYLSQLCGAKVPPASDKVNRALGEILSLVTEISPDQLLLESYREKAPTEIRELIDQSTR